MLLAIGLGGLVLAGPGRLLIPLNVLTFWGNFAWLLWAAFYLIVAQIVIWKLQRRIVVYNFSVAEMVPKLWETVQSLDATATWVGNSMALPKCGVQFYWEAAPKSRNIVLVAAGPNQSVTGWQQLETATDLAFRTISVKRGPISLFFLLASIVLIAAACWTL